MHRESDFGAVSLPSSAKTLKESSVIAPAMVLIEEWIR